MPNEDQNQDEVVAPDATPIEADQNVEDSPSPSAPVDGGVLDTPTADEQKALEEEGELLERTDNGPRPEDGEQPDQEEEGIEP